MVASNVTATAAFADDFPPATLLAWRGLIDKALKGGDFERRLVASTADGIRIEPLFTERPSGWPQPTAQPTSDGPAWDIRQLHSGVDPVAVNAAILEDLAGGATSVTLRMASNGCSGLPSDAAAVARALEGVLLDVCPIALQGGEETPDAVAALVALWNHHQLPDERKRAAFNHDPLGTLAATGALAVPLPSALAAASRLVHTTLPWPEVTALRADGHVWHAAGASEAQELAAVLSTVVAYLRAAEAAGIAPGHALPKIVVNLAVDADQMLGLAKLRAARRLIARVAAACNAEHAAAAVAITAETSRAMMTRRDPWVNMLRTTMACAAAAMGCAQSITVLPYTWALGEPDAFARRMARNTSLVLMEESGLGRVADPAAGSFAVETLTDDLAQAAWALFQIIEAEGGIKSVIQSGWLQNKIAATVAAKQAALATGKVVLTGTSAFPRLGDDGVAVKPWPAPQHVLPSAAGVNVTALDPYCPSRPFERLRDRADQATVTLGQPPRVFLACLGPLAVHAARATWTANFLAVGGIAVSQSEPLLHTAEVGRAFADSGASVACLCGADATYAELGEAAASMLRTAGATEVYLAGRPKERGALEAAGVSHFVHAGCDMVEVLAAMQDALGVPREAA